jgi:hypothetical protein
MLTTTMPPPLPLKVPAQILREFLETFEVGGVKDGVVTPEEFHNYYQNVSNSVDNDDYFELMIRNAWHISGGEGWCANTSNRRVLVRDAQVLPSFTFLPSLTFLSSSPSFLPLPSITVLP